MSLREHLIAAVSLIVVALTCFIAGRATAPGRVTVRDAEAAANVVVLHDAVNEATCWRITGGDGLACLPDQWLARAQLEAWAVPSSERLVQRWEPAE